MPVVFMRMRWHWLNTKRRAGRHVESFRNWPREPIIASHCHLNVQSTNHREEASFHTDRIQRNKQNHLVLPWWMFVSIKDQKESRDGTEGRGESVAVKLVTDDGTTTRCETRYNCDLVFVSMSHTQIQHKWPWPIWPITRAVLAPRLARAKNLSRIPTLCASCVV